MGGYRAQANHALYLARILATGWQRAIEEAHTPGISLAQAYEPAICNHLIAAYGWFLLEITQPDPAPELPPRGCEQLPPPPEGRVLPGEVLEFRQLEQRGWLRDLLRERGGAVARARTQGNLASAAASMGPADFMTWADRLEALFGRMSDSLDEY